MCNCKDKESTYWYKYSYFSFTYESSQSVQDFITTDDFQSWWLGFKDEGDELEMVVKL